MPWSNQGGGGGPWGTGSGRGPVGGPPPPDLEEILRKGQERFRRMMPGGVGGTRGIVVVLLAIVALWLFSGFYRVEAEQQGVVLRFGKWVRTTTPGLNWHLPYPIEDVERPQVTRVNREEIGFRSAGDTSRSDLVRQVPEEALMLTGDENIVDINFTVFWRIKDAGKFLFNVRGPDATVKAVAESTMREIIGQTPIAQALAEGRGKIESITLEHLQTILDEYGSGILITEVQLLKVDPPGPVVDAFRDVQRARADQERLRNEAEAYRNDIIPRARGESEQIIQQAEAYKQEVINLAEGEASRFLAVYNEFRQARDVTSQRLYLETMEKVLAKANKIIIDSGASGSGVVPYLPLPEVQKRVGKPAGAQQGTGGQTR